MIRFKEIRQKAGYLAAAALGVAGAAYLLLTSHLEALRTFNYGVQAYQDERFDAAVASFRRSVELASNPAAVYNFALASWAAVKDASNASGKEDETTTSRKEIEERIRTAHDAIAKALDVEGLDDAKILDLIYFDARLLALEGKTEEARARLREVLSQEDDFKPALRELVRIDMNEEDAARELLVVLAEDGEPEIITKYTFGSSASERLGSSDREVGAPSAEP